MRDISKIALALAAIVLIAAPLFCDSSSGDSQSASIEGYVKINGVLSNNDSIKIVVHYPIASSSEYTMKSTVGLDSSGHFKIDDIPSGTVASSCLISFILNGYSVSGLPSQIQSTTEIMDGQLCYYLSPSIGTLMANTTHVLGDSNLYPISMTSSYGSVTGRVVTETAATVGLNNASVTIETEDGNTIATAKTSGGGYFEIERCSTGDYVIVVRMNGYETYTDDISIGQGSTTELGEIRITDSGGLFGMDLGHILMVLAAIITTSIILVSMYHIIRSRRN